MGFGGRGGTRRRAAAAVLLLGLAAAGCSSDGGSGSSGGGGSHTASAPAVGPDDPAAARAEIEKNWAAFFDTDVPAAQKTRLVENGTALAPLLASVGSDPKVSGAEAEVTGVAFSSPTEAQVTYELTVHGLPVVSDAKGTAVLRDDVWKVSAKTLCSLVKMAGTTAPGC
ncbi:hypothetical protein [Streptomyces sp. NPDC012888]|uniref:hypothetical protein n=1 Tax=Streptomyces sp. NPDC012888 TaxID=3364855 RepID=UPI0036CFCD2C